MKISLVNHGCAKNLVDSEIMLGILANNGFDITLNEDEAQIAIVNTCSFIHDAEKESVQSILRLIENGKKVIVTGCLAQKYSDELKKAIPELSAMVGIADINNIADVVNKVIKKNNYIQEVCLSPRYIYPENVERQQITVGASSYLKIGEGCNYKCGYCIIPQLRGNYVSRPIENIVKEAKWLVEKGVSEIILIAQDTSSYGLDLYNRQALPQLLEELNKIENLSWIRIMYAYPTMMTDELLKAIAKLDKVVKYVDIPLQHSHPRVLKEMKRPVIDNLELIKKIRKIIPDVTIRTSLIVGYPTETDEEFEHLYNFVKEARFDRMGAFEYSREKNTYSYSLKPQVSAKTKKQRRKKLMEIQQNISKEINRGFVGGKLNCIVEGFDDKGMVILRSHRDAPEIDGVVYATSTKSVVPGDIETVSITDYDEYDLYGQIV